MLELLPELIVIADGVPADEAWLCRQTHLEHVLNEGCLLIGGSTSPHAAIRCKVYQSGRAILEHVRSESGQVFLIWPLSVIDKVESRAKRKTNNIQHKTINLKTVGHCPLRGGSDR